MQRKMKKNANETNLFHNFVSEHFNPYIMTSRQKKLTEREQALILYSVFCQDEDIRKVYRLTRADEGKTLKDINTSAYRWRHNEVVEKAFEDASIMFNAFKQRLQDEAIKDYTNKLYDLRQRQKAREGIEEVEKGVEGEEVIKELERLGNDLIDFTDRNEFLQYLNERANRVTDDKQKTETLKMLSDLLRFKEDKAEGTNDIQRFYTPMTCKGCELYKREAETLENS